MELTDNGIYKCRIYEWEGKVTIIKDGCEVTDQEVLEWWGLDKPTQKCAFNHARIELIKGRKITPIPPSNGFMAIHAWWGFDCITHPFSFVRHTECKEVPGCCVKSLSYEWPSCRRVTIIPPGRFDIVYNDRDVYTSYPEGTIIKSKIWIEEVCRDYVAAYNSFNCKEVLSMRSIDPDYSNNVIIPEV